MGAEWSCDLYCQGSCVWACVNKLSSSSSHKDNFTGVGEEGSLDITEVAMDVVWQHEHKFLRVLDGRQLKWLWLERRDWSVIWEKSLTLTELGVKGGGTRSMWQFCLIWWSKGLKENHGRISSLGGRMPWQNGTVFPLVDSVGNEEAEAVTQ